MTEAIYSVPSLCTQGSSQTNLPVWPWVCYLAPSRNLPCSPAPKGNPFRGNLSGILFPGGSYGKESACNVEYPGSIPGLERFPREGNGYPLRYSCLENSRDRGAWRSTVHGVTKSQIGLSNYHFHCFYYVDLNFFLIMRDWSIRVS